MKEFNLEKTVKSLLTTVRNHIGSNNSEAHLPATIKTNGFMSYSHVEQLNQALGQRKYLNGANILDLAPGFYEVVDPQNGPLAEAGIYEIDITVQGSRKQIKAMQSYTGRIWMYNEHTNNTAVLGWREIDQKIEIFNVDDAGMSSTPVGTKIEIKSPFKFQNFKAFEFDVNFSLRDLAIRTGYFSLNNSVELNTVNLRNNGLTVYVYELGMNRVSDTTLEIYQNLSRALYANGSGSSTADKENEIKLTKIRGIL